MKLVPEILQQPNIPVPLHGLAPRVVFGEKWWNMEREKAYQSNDNYRICCGRHKLMTETRQLEAHEFWKFDYENGVGEVTDIVPLCHYCHNFIHSGRLIMIMGEEKTREEVKAIFEHGYKILDHYGLRVFPGTHYFAKQLGVDTLNVVPYEIALKMKMDNWKMIYKGKEYFPEDYVK